MTQIQACVLLCLFSAQIALRAVSPQEAATVPTDSPDAEVNEFRLRALETKVQTMQPGPEHDYFAGVLANRSGRIDESILLLNRVLPTIRQSQPKRPAIALETLADDYTKTFRYADAARTYDDLLAHFAGQLDSAGKSIRCGAELIVNLSENVTCKCLKISHSIFLISPKKFDK